MYDPRPFCAMKRWRTVSWQARTSSKNGAGAFQLAAPGAAHAGENAPLRNLARLADALLSDYLVPFEVEYLLLLVAVGG